MKPKKLKRVPLKEELVALTKDFKIALVLQQLIFWNERCDDFDKYIEEEKERAALNNEEISSSDKTNGWIYKAAKELSKECLMFVGEKQMLRYLKTIRERGWVDTRRNPKYKWDKTLQYRVNLLRLHEDLTKIGYNLDGYSFNVQDDKSKETRCPIDEDKKSLGIGQEERAIPEITTENTLEITSAKAETNFKDENKTDKTKTNSNLGLISSHLSSDTNSNTEQEKKKFSSPEKNINDMTKEEWDALCQACEPPPKINRKALRKKHNVRFAPEYYQKFCEAKEKGFNGNAEEFKNYVVYESSIWDKSKGEPNEELFLKEMFCKHPIAQHYLNLTPEQRELELAEKSH